LAQLDAEAGGIFNAALIDPAAARGLFRQAVAGDRQAGALFRLLLTALAEPNWLDGSRLCACCDHEFHELPAAFVLLVPRRDDPGVFIAVGLCAECDAGQPVEEIIREVWPGLRPLAAANLHRNGGRA
jgi:hypothetical protein